MGQCTNRDWLSSFIGDRAGALIERRRGANPPRRSVARTDLVLFHTLQRRHVALLGVIGFHTIP